MLCAGTLTQNVMGFVWCSIAGRLYGKDAPSGLDTPHTITQDPVLLKALEAGQGEQYQQAADFLTHLAVCNTVVPATDALGHLIYQVSLALRHTLTRLHALTTHLVSLCRMLISRCAGCSCLALCAVKLRDLAACMRLMSTLLEYQLNGEHGAIFASSVTGSMSCASLCIHVSCIGCLVVSQSQLQTSLQLLDNMLRLLQSDVIATGCSPITSCSCVLV